MALRENSTRIQFSGGIERKMGEQSVPTVRLLALEDAVFTKAVSLTKRDGYEDLGAAILGSASTLANQRGLAARGADLIQFTEGTSYSYVESAGAWDEIDDGVMSLRQSDRALVKTVSNQTSCDYAEANGVALVAWEDSRGGVYYAVTVASGKRVTIPATQADALGTRPRCVRAGDNLVLLWSLLGGGLFSIVVDPAAPHRAGPVQPVIDDLVPALPNFDACYAPSDTPGSGAALVWNSTTGVRTGWLTPGGLLGTLATGWLTPVTTTLGGTLTAGPVVSVMPDGKKWMVAWAEDTDVHAMAFTATDLSTLLAENTAASNLVTVNRIAIGYRGTGSGTVAADVWAEYRHAPSVIGPVTPEPRLSVVGHYLFQWDDTFAAPTRQFYRASCLASSGWCDTPTSGAARGFITLLHSAPLQSTYLTVRDDGLLVAQTVPGNAGDAPGHRLPRVTSPDDDRSYKMALVYKTKLDALNNDVFTESGPRLVTLDFDAADAYQTVLVNGTLYLGAAVTQLYDGVSWVEATPAYAPDWNAAEVLHVNAATGGAMTDGTRNYKFWYEETLANGLIVRGPVSKPYQVVTLVGETRTTISIPTLTISAWGRVGGVREGCRIAVARTVDGDASLYYRVSSLDPSTAGTANGYLENSQVADSVSFIDEMTDATLVTKEPLYTTGGIPSNDALGTSGIIFEGKNRIFVGASSDPNLVYFSQEQATGYTAEFTPELATLLPPAGGDLTGGVVMGDDRVLLLKETAAYAITGTGPLPDPTQGGEWSTPAGLPPGVGCIDQRTMAVYELGVIFKSKKGWWTIDRGMQASYIGAPVEAYNSLTAVRATTSDDAADILFLHSDGVALHYNTLFGQWSVWKNHAGLDGVISNGVYHYLRTDGRVFRRTAGVYADETQPLATAIATAWVVPSEARQGKMHVWTAQVLGVWKSAHTLSVQWMFDYDETDNWSEPVLFDATDMGGSDYGDGNYGDGDYGGSTPARYQWEVFIGRPCQAIRFRFTFPEAAGTFGACAELTELRLTFGVFGNLNKLPAERMG